MFVDNNPIHKIIPEHRLANTTYNIDMSNSYNLHISPLEHDGKTMYAFSVGTDPAVRDVTERFISPGWQEHNVDFIYDKLTSMSTIPVMRQNIINDPWDHKTSTALAQYMEEMVHPIKSQDLVARWGNTFDFVSPKLYDAICKTSAIYDNPADKQTMALAMIATDLMINEPERSLSPEEQHHLNAEELDSNDKIEDDLGDDFEKQ